MKEDIVREMLVMIGEDPDREGIQDTPRRVVNMWNELFAGYDENNKPKITTFKNGTDGLTYDQMIVDTGDYYSQCEHHMVPFFGQYWFAYIPHPEGKILGLSKVARVVDFYSAKLQVQERLVHEIVEELWASLKDDNMPLGMALVMRGEHLCKTMRGAKKKGKMTTIKLKGVFRENEVKTEFLTFVGNGK